jgi:hypothetical protein
MVNIFSTPPLWIGGEGNDWIRLHPEPGKIKGVPLFHLASILAFIERCEVEAKVGG